MTDEIPPTEHPTATAIRVRRLRLRIIPATFLLILTSAGICGFYLEMIEVVRIHTKFHWTQIDPRYHAAITPRHVTIWLLSVVTLQCAGVTTYAWLYGKWQAAWIGMAILVTLIFATQTVESSPLWN